MDQPQHLSAADDDPSKKAQLNKLEVDRLSAAAHASVELALASSPVQQGQLLVAREQVEEALEVCRRVVGTGDLRCAKLHELAARILVAQGELTSAFSQLKTARHVRKAWSGGEETDHSSKLLLHMAEVAALGRDGATALMLQKEAVDELIARDRLPAVTIDASMQLAVWQQEQAKDEDALQTLLRAEQLILDNLGMEEPRMIRLKRDMALLHLKLHKPEAAVRNLHDVEYLERRLHGAVSIQVARTLKARGAVHLAQQALDAAEACFLEALSLFGSCGTGKGGAAACSELRDKLATIRERRRHAKAVVQSQAGAGSGSGQEMQVSSDEGVGA